MNPKGSSPLQGIICIWYGVQANVPDGWTICDGTNGTPDLRDCFVRCPGPSYAVHSSGGGRYHSHWNETRPDTHDHEASSAIQEDGLETGQELNTDYPDGYWSATTVGHNHDITVEPKQHKHVGYTNPADHNPSYYCLWYIMKL